MCNVDDDKENLDFKLMWEIHGAQPWNFKWLFLSIKHHLYCNLLIKSNLLVKLESITAFIL